MTATTDLHAIPDQEDNMPTTTAPTESTDLQHLRAVAAEGQRASETIAAAEHVRQEQRTAALHREHAAWDDDLTRRGPRVDEALTVERREALGDLQAAVERGDLDGAFACWRREAGARVAQRAFRADWRAAHERTGTGESPPPESLREGERDEALAFVPTLERAAAQSAALESEVRLGDLLTERPTALPGEVLPGEASSLLHAEHCTDPARVEVTEPPAGRHSAGRVARCMACGVSRVLHLPEPEAEDEQAAAPGPALLRSPGSGDYAPAADSWPAA